MKLKLTEIQNHELLASLSEQQIAEENYMLAREQFLKAQKNRKRVVNLIADSHSIVLSEYREENMVLENSYLVLDESKPTLNQKTNAKAKTEK